MNLEDDWMMMNCMNYSNVDSKMIASDVDSSQENRDARLKYLHNDEENIIDVSAKSLDSLWASEQGSFNTNALEAHMLATRWDVCYKLAVSWVCIVD